MADQSTEIFVGNDHAGYALKKQLLDLLKSEFPALKFEDCGSSSEESVDYPDLARVVGEKVAARNARGILICGSGIGMAIAANKIPGIRAAQAWDATSARLSRLHNNSNIVCFGARLSGFEVAADICRVWLNTSFAGGRHQKRVDGITSLERNRP